MNRVWQYHFGRGIVGTASEFGKLGEPPTHPELLDYLTAKFVADGWHLKPLHREILLSATYRQTARHEPDEATAKVDPSNRYLWRFHPRRLDAEQVRDALLAVSGELDAKPGGPAGDGNGTRRSVYTMKKRNSPNELLRALDMPGGFASTAERQSTTTPTQALQLINGDWLLARASKLAARVHGIDEAWLAVLGRPPEPQEKTTAEAFSEKADQGREGCAGGRAREKRCRRHGLQRQHAARASARGDEREGGRRIHRRGRREARQHRSERRAAHAGVAMGWRQGQARNPLAGALM